MGRHESLDFHFYYLCKKTMYRLNCKGKILDLSVPAVMGILNVTHDSFFDGGSYITVEKQLKQAERMLNEGASVIDIGAISTRPGSMGVTIESEMEMLLPALKAVRKSFPSAIISADTFRSQVAKAAVDNGADMINDIYGGRFESSMMKTIASLKVPYILMHMKGDPSTMQKDPRYSDVVAETVYFFEKQLELANSEGIINVIIDPGFGFGKTVEHNYKLLSRLDAFQSLGVPVMAGISRKSMAYSVLGLKPADALNATSILNTIALMMGASILRVHDVKEAVEAVKIIELMKKHSSPDKNQS
jgi:dihydropteroate synthase